MPQQMFGRLKPSLNDRRRRRHLLLLAGVSTAALILALPSRAATFVYADGDDNAAPITLTGNNGFITGSGAGESATQSGIISGTGSLSKQGNGKLKLTGDNTYSGGTNLVQGYLVLGHNNAMGTGIVTSMGGSLEFNAGSALVIANDFALGAGTIMHTTTGTTLTGAISGLGRLTKAGGSQTLTLEGANTYQGGTYITEGRVHVGNNNALGTGSVFFSQAWGSAELSYEDGITVSNNVVVNSNGTFIVSSGTATQSGTISKGSGNNFLSKDGAGELVITGASTAGGMGFTIRGGKLTTAAANILDAGGTYTPWGTAVLNIVADQKIGFLTGNGTVDLNSQSLTLAGWSGFGTFSGKLVGTVDANLIKAGNANSALELSGDGLGYNGQISLQIGTLIVSGDFTGTPVFVTGGALKGSGKLGDVFVDGGTLTGNDGTALSMRDLSLTANSIIQANLGAANASALFNVAGDLQLDGTLNVSNVGGFGQGLYRIFSYGGALDDRGLELGTLPEGYDANNLTLQTAVGGQVNLVADDPDYGPVVFWDGDNVANHNNRRVDGGDGRWRRGGSAFTDANGIANGSQDPVPGFVIFTGNAGRVVVDTGFGEIHPDGMQFAVDGYYVTGELISWDDGDRFVRVGDGTSAGAGFTAEITNVIDGGGRLVKSDLGTLILSGENAYRGGTFVQGGTLVVDGSILDVEVGVDGRLGGTGSVENAYIGGTLAAGNSIGRLTVEGDLTMAAGSRLEMEVDALGNAYRIDVTGVAYLEGGQVVTLASGGDYADTTRYTILSAEGGVEGEFEGVSSNLAFLDAALSYGAKEVELTLTRNGVTYANVGETRNQIAAGAAVESLAAGNSIYDRVLTLSAQDARYAFDQVSGEVHASAKGVAALESRQLRDAMSDRVTAAFDRLGLPEGEKSIGTGLWSTGAAEGGSLKGDGNAAGLSYSAGNLFVGGDAMFNQDWLLGFAVGAGQSQLNIADRNSTSTSGNFHVGVYGGGEVSDFTFKFGAGYTHNDIKTSRTAAFPGFEETLTAKYSGSTTQAFGEIGHKFSFDSGLIIEPYANLALVNVHTGSYAEEGGVSALSSNGGDFGAATFTFGLRGSQQFVIGDGRKATATGAIGWTHTAAGTPEAQQAFATGNSFVVAGAPIQGDSLFLKAGLGIELSESANVTLGYAGRLGTQGQSHAINAGLSVKF